MKKAVQIKSSAQAAAEARKIKPGASAYGKSEESYLALRTLIYCAELLERMERRQPKKKQARSAWQSFLSAEMKSGSTIQAAAAKWSARKKTAVRA